MKPLYTFDCPGSTKMTCAKKLGAYPHAWSEGVNGWIKELQWPEVYDHASPIVFLKATLWGSEIPWRADEALAEIAERSGAQDPTLEAYFPDALYYLWEMRAKRDPELMRAIWYRPAAPFRVIFPALAASWNEGADISAQGDPHRRRNSLGRRKAMAVCHEVDRRRGYPGRISATKLFPCGASGDEFEQPVDSFLLQIHR